MSAVLGSLIGHPEVAPFPIPDGHVGPVSLPGTNREVWWTGRVAIGLRYEPARGGGAFGEYATWLQDLLLESARRDAKP